MSIAIAIYCVSRELFIRCQTNHLHLQTNLVNKMIQVNASGWGKIISEDEFIELKKKHELQLLLKRFRLITFCLMSCQC